MAEESGEGGDGCGGSNAWGGPWTLRRILIVGGVLIAVMLFLVFIVWVVLHPSKPRFILQDASIYAFNISSPYRLSTSLQVTLSSQNPNSRIAIYYDTIDAYAAYRGQQITMPTSLPSAFQGHNDLTVWSPLLYGDSIPIAPYYGDAFLQDQIAGVALIHIKVIGKIRWKVGSLNTLPYRLDVSCPAYVSFDHKNVSNFVIPIGSLTKFRLVQSCNVDI